MFKKSKASADVFLGLSAHLSRIRLRIFSETNQTMCLFLSSTLLNFQGHRICTPNETVCATEIRKDPFGCRVSCTGLYADVSFSEGNPEDTTKDGAMIQDSKVFSQLIQDYKAYKSTFVKNVKFNSTSLNLGINNSICEYWYQN